MTRQRVVILGGGMASLVAAFELTRTPELRRRHQVTVLQHGHRLGGKGASGVNPDQFHRIEEHGLHVLFGFYDNVFRVLRECYEELGRPPGTPLATWREAVTPQNFMVLSERVGDEVHWWPLFLPANDEVPGDDTDLGDPWRYLTRILAWAAFLVREWTGRSADLKTLKARTPPAVHRAFNRLVLRRNRAGELSAIRLAQLAGRLLRPASGRDSADKRFRRLPLPPRSRRWLRSSSVVATELRRLLVLLGLALTIVRGILADGLVASPPRWFDIDDEDFRMWLRRHGASETTLNSPLVLGLYHAVFAVHEPLGAGTMLQAILRIVFTYKGSILYRMQAGMGETVFAPLYQVLRRRGVRFEFFHSARVLELSDDRSQVARIRVDRQATVAGEEYEPLIDVDGLPCWPTRPRYEQIVEGDAIREGGHDLDNWWSAWPAVGEAVLEAGRDFDVAVLGISVGVVGEICQQLVDDAANPRFRTMVGQVRTTSTQAAQLWFGSDLEELGWAGPSGRHVPLLIPFNQPFDTWSDMSYLLDRERWPPDRRPKQLSYMCAPLVDDEPPPPRHDHGYPARQSARVAASLDCWLREHAPRLLPALQAQDGPAWHHLVDQVADQGSSRLESQYHCAVTHPSDRYVLSVPGSVHRRLRADESGYSNLVLAGDWTKTALSIGCLEAAAMSGFAAARAIDPGCRRAYGDWLPERPEVRQNALAPTCRTVRRL